ncbi:MAG: hypothetical protein JNK25_11100 [Phycisphaerae bacterium]|nr:hypothetical protein [Phycisphaerae bacterium]
MRSFKRKTARASMIVAACAGAAISGTAAAQTVFYSENFDSAVLDQLSGDPRVTSVCASNEPSFTHVPPAGWTWGGCGVPTYACRVGGCPPRSCSTCNNNEGIFEWEGWSFARKDFWVRVAEDQNRSQFTLGTGIVAVADPDEWDDRGNPDINCGQYNAWMSTPTIAIADVTPGSLSFQFASSWRPEGFDDLPDNNQTAIIRAYYTVGGVEQDAVEVLRWDSDDQNIEPGDYFKPDATNELVVLDPSGLMVPEGATSVRFEFGLIRAANDWWWAIDNLVMSGEVGGTPTTIFSEDFEGVTLQNPVHEIPTGCGTAYCGQFTHTHTGPNGVTVTVDSPATGGVPDWRGWSFVRRPFWVCAAGSPNGQGFTNSSGIVAVADGDEFDDIAHSPGPLDTTLSTPAIDISSRAGSVFVVSFDSSWRFESGQTVWLEARFNDAAGTVVEALRWESDTSSPFFKGDAVNERVAIALVAPTDATTVSLHFRYQAGNNWWWAIDNLSVFEGIADVTVAANTPNSGPMSVAPSVDYAPCFTPWSPAAPSGWSQSFEPIGSCPVECGRPEWRGWAFAFKDWWWQQVDNQLRSEFTRGSGYIAIADPDEWDDYPNGRSNFNAFMSTPSIPLPGMISSASVTFDSSWRYEGFDDSCSCDPVNPPFTNNQTAKITAYYTVAGTEQPGIDVLHWDSDDGVNSGTGTPSPYFKPDNTNEAVVIGLSDLSVPAGAESVRFEFSLTNARNDWWWAIDNVIVNVNDAPVFSEGFEVLPGLAAPPSENPPVDQCRYFSTVATQGGNFSVDNGGLTSCQPGDDFYGFNAWLVDAWARHLGGLRDEHGAEHAYISDLSARGCNGVARLLTPTYTIGTINPGTLTLTFRSGWFSEPGHASSIEVSFDGGSFVPVLAWSPSNKATTTDEVVSVPLDNPAGARTVRIRFSDAESGWWAISGILLTGQVGTEVCPACAADFNRDGGVDGSDVEAFFLTWELGEACGDTNLDGGVDGGDVEAFFLVWEQGGC